MSATHPDDDAAALMAAETRTAAAPTIEPEIPATVGRYQVMARLGAGGMGVVYDAFDPRLQRRVALKVVRPNAKQDDTSSSPTREAMAMAQLSHPAIVPVFDVGELPGPNGELVFIAMELVEGGTLGDWLKAGSRSWTQVVRQFLAAAAGLAAAHARGIVHRDFKPANVLVGLDGRVRVTDFGLARAHGAELPDASVDESRASATHTRSIAGTPGYMPPEALEGVVDTRGDQFSFCVSLYEALYGERPFDVHRSERSMPVLADAVRRQAIRKPPAGSRVPMWLRQVLLRGLEASAADRWPSMDALIAVIERRMQRRRRIALGVGALVGVGLIAATVLLVMRREPAAPITHESTPWQERRLTNRGAINGAELSPDGKLIAASTPTDLVVMPVSGGEPRVLSRKVGEKAAWFPLAWAPDSRHLFVVADTNFDGGVATPVNGLVDIETGTMEPIDQTHASAYSRVAFLGPRSVVVSSPGSTELELIDLDGDHAPRRCTLPGSRHNVYLLRVVGDEVLVQVRHDDGAISVFRTNPHCSEVHTTLNHSPIDFVFFTHAGLLGIGSTDDHGAQTMVVVDDSGRPLTAPRPLPYNTVEHLGTLEDGSLVTLQGNYSWRLHEASAGGSVEILEGTGYFVQIAVDAERQRIALGEFHDGKADVRVIDISTRNNPSRPTRALMTGVEYVAWSPNGQRLAAASSEGGVRLVVADLAAGSSSEPVVTDMPAEPDLEWLDDRRLAYQRADSRGYGWVDVVDGTRGDVPIPAGGIVANLKVSPADGALAFQWDRDGDIGIWILPAEATEPYRVPDAYPIHGHAWTPDGKALWIFTQLNGKMKRYDLASGTYTPLDRVSLTPTARVVDVFPLSTGGALIHTFRWHRDVVVFGPPNPLDDAGAAQPSAGASSW